MGTAAQYHAALLEMMEKDLKTLQDNETVEIPDRIYLMLEHKLLPIAKTSQMKFNSTPRITRALKNSGYVNIDNIESGDIKNIPFFKIKYTFFILIKYK